MKVVEGYLEISSHYFYPKDKIIEVMRYVCDYCGAMFDTLEKCKEHSDTCLKNYTLKNCYTCIYNNFIKPERCHTKCRSNGMGFYDEGSTLRQSQMIIISNCPKYQKEEDTV